jgi:hypothetical protein
MLSVDAKFCIYERMYVTYLCFKLWQHQLDTALEVAGKERAMANMLQVQG